MNFYQFLSDSPFLAFFIALIVGRLAFSCLVTLPDRIMRHWNIRKHGYPPAHCDADGDFHMPSNQKG